MDNKKFLAFSEYDVQCRLSSLSSPLRLFMEMKPLDQKCSQLYHMAKRTQSKPYHLAS